MGELYLFSTVPVVYDNAAKSFLVLSGDPIFILILPVFFWTGYYKINPWSIIPLLYCVCINEEFVEFAIAWISVMFRFFFTFRVPFPLSCWAMACFALMNCSVLLIWRMISLYLDYSALCLFTFWPTCLLGESELKYYGRACNCSFWYLTKLLWLICFRPVFTIPIPGAAYSLSTEWLWLPYRVLLIASGNLLYFFKGNLKTRSSDFANFSSISFLKSMSSVSIFELMYLGFVSGPPVKATMFP